MGDHGRDLEFVVSVDPTAAVVATTRALVRQGDAGGLDSLPGETGS